MTQRLLTGLLVLAGVVCAQHSVDPGHSVSLSTSSNSNYSLPAQVSPGGNGSMASNAIHGSSWPPVSLTGPNGDQATTTYDSYGRPSQTTIPDGAVTTYTYGLYRGRSHKLSGPGGCSSNQQHWVSDVLWVARGRTGVTRVALVGERMG